MYNLELEKTIEQIKNSKAKQILIQLPDGLKPQAQEIVEEIEGAVGDCCVFIWAGDCFGGCDIPLEVGNLGVDLIIQFGHNKFEKQGKW